MPRETVTVRLQNPLTVGERTITEVTLRMPKVKDQLAASRVSNNNADIEVNLIGQISGLGAKAISELDMPDYLKIQEAAIGFLSPASALSSPDSPPPNTATPSSD